MTSAQVLAARMLCRMSWDQNEPVSPAILQMANLRMRDEHFKQHKTLGGAINAILNPKG